MYAPDISLPVNDALGLQLIEKAAQPLSHLQEAGSDKKMYRSNKTTTTKSLSDHVPGSELQWSCEFLGM